MTDIEGRKMYLHLAFYQKETTIFHFTLFSPFWFINKSGLRLLYKERFFFYFFLFFFFEFFFGFDSKNEKNFIHFFLSFSPLLILLSFSPFSSHYLLSFSPLFKKHPYPKRAPRSRTRRSRKRNLDTRRTAVTLVFSRSRVRKALSISFYVFFFVHFGVTEKIAC